MNSNDKKDIDIYEESAHSAFSVMGAMIVLMMACMVLLPSDVQVNGMDVDTLRSWFMKHALGLSLLYISVMMMQSEWIDLIQKFPRLNTFAEKLKGTVSTFKTT